MNMSLKLLWLTCGSDLWSAVLTLMTDRTHVCLLFLDNPEDPQCKRLFHFMDDLTMASSTMASSPDMGADDVEIPEHSDYPHMRECMREILSKKHVQMISRGAYIIVYRPYVDTSGLDAMVHIEGAGGSMCASVLNIHLFHEQSTHLPVCVVHTPAYHVEVDWETDTRSQ
jgi:hypothetical protein